MATNKLSPMMEHFLTVKREYPDAIILYRLGDFYEMFFDDAIKASKILDLTLTGRDCGLSDRAPMCGVPYHAADNYIAKLVKSGEKVAICEQLSAPGDQVGMVKREVIKVITSGTVTDEASLDSQKNNYLLSILQKDDVFAIAYCDITTGELNILDKLQSKAIAEEMLLKLAPSEVISTERTSKLLSTFDAVIHGKLPKPTAYYDYTFISDNAKNQIKEFFGIISLAGLGIDENSLMLQPLGALLHYIANTQKTNLSNINFPKIISPKDAMFVDYSTIRNLELLETMQDKEKKGSLLDVLDKTCTKMGARTLRKWLIAPLQNKIEIESRLNALDELYKSHNMRADLTKSLNTIRDIERLTQKISSNTINPRECLHILIALQQLPTLIALLSKSKSSMLNSILLNIDSLPALSNLLSLAINPNDTPISTKEGGVIKDGYSEKLDSYRSASKDGKAWLREFEVSEKAKTNIKTLKVGYNRIFGFYIEVSASQKNLVPYSYERRQTLANAERYITPELKKMESIILGAEEKAVALEEILYQEIRNELSNVVKILQKNAEMIGVLDVLCSIATVSNSNNYVKPTILSTNEVKISAARHPVVESFKKINEFVSNDVLLNNDNKLLIITGPNMAGKSTYMRETALIVLMAHCGFFVPASKAEIGLFDRIFTRVGASDNLAYGQSTFMVEMTEIASILNSATENSLLILDEIGRGTSTLDGLSIAWAIAEHIALKTKAKTLFATHYHELSELENLLPATKNYHILIRESDDTIVFLYKIARGGANRSFGIEVAKLAGVNQKVIARAKEVLITLENTHIVSQNLNEKLTSCPSSDAVPTSQIGFFESPYQSIIDALKELDVNNLTPIQALTLLIDLKKQLKERK